jgi:hypothetical protein
LDLDLTVQQHGTTQLTGANLVGDSVEEDIYNGMCTGASVDGAVLVLNFVALEKVFDNLVISIEVGVGYPDDAIARGLGETEKCRHIDGHACLGMERRYPKARKRSGDCEMCDIKPSKRFSCG